ncbi:hypothetical protein [Anaerocolumna sp.]|uniref:hypothetical protein n=1 Tax=Anaerocolumna sp. TaxID=2041569 RepID=UPI0028A64B58|nr:hypothetical protein [Anaerocolumna sp.]
MKKRKYTILFICIITACLALAACGKKKEGDNTGKETITPSPAPTSTPTPTPTVTPNITPTPEEPDYISEADAIKNIQKVIGERGYTIELLEDNLMVDGKEYYKFQISDSLAVIEPDVIVDKLSGEIFCYYQDGIVSTFEEHPLFTQTTKDPEETSHDFTKEDALAKLNEVPGKILNLPAELSEYTIIYDDWTTMVNGVECYGINAFAEVKDNKRVNMGVYYVAVDGSAMFQFDSLSDDFVEIK